MSLFLPPLSLDRRRQGEGEIPSKRGIRGRVNIFLFFS
jgi:hypothetical protein